MTSFFRLLGSELRLSLGRRRNWFGLGVLAAVPLLLAVVIYYAGRRGGGRGGGDIFSQILGNGLFVPLAALTVEVTVFLPLAMAMLAADSIAGEAHEGTLRYLLTVPVGRTRLLLTKFVSLVVGAFLGVFLVVGVGAVVGVALFGAGPMLTLSGTTITASDALGRVVLAGLYVWAGMVALTALGLFISTLSEQPMAVIVIIMVIVATMWILVGLEQAAWLHPYLLVGHWTDFIDLLRQPPALDGIMDGLKLDAAYVLVFLAAAWARFVGKDITG